MDRLEFEETQDTPKVLLDKATGNFEIAGRSLPEDVLAFYNPVINWLKVYSSQPNPATDFVFKLDYFNTSSSKIILDLIGLLQHINGAKIVWCYQEDDMEIREAGEEFSEQVDIPFEFRKY